MKKISTVLHNKGLPNISTQTPGVLEPLIRNHCPRQYLWTVEVPSHYLHTIAVVSTPASIIYLSFPSLLSSAVVDNIMPSAPTTDACIIIFIINTIKKTKNTFNRCPSIKHQYYHT